MRFANDFVSTYSSVSFFQKGYAEALLKKYGNQNNIYEDISEDVLGHEVIHVLCSDINCMDLYCPYTK